jgi:dienelactone hydrolase
MTDRLFRRGRGRVLALVAGTALVVAGATLAAQLRSPDAQTRAPESGGTVARPDGGPDPGAPGPYAAGWRNITVADPDGGSFVALMTYPAQSAGEGAAPDAAGAPYPAVTFGHGFVQTPDRYQGSLEHLATWGYVTIAPASHAGLTPDHAAFAADLRQSLDWLLAQSADGASWLAGLVDPTALGASGHSMGGGASLLAAADEPDIRAVASLAAAETRPSAAAAVPQVTAPLAFIVGQADEIVPPENTAPLYEAAGPPRQFLELAGGTHCGFQDDPFPIFCDGGRNEAQLASTRRLLTAFFELYLRRDGQWTEWVWGPSPYDGEVAAARSDPGVTLLPAENVALVPAGGSARVPLAVTNTGRAAARFALAVTAADWPAELSPASTPELAPGASFACAVTIHRPADAPEPVNPLLLSARATAPDGLTATFASILADAREPNPIRLALPWLAR